MQLCFKINEILQACQEKRVTKLQQVTTLDITKSPASPVIHTSISSGNDQEFLDSINLLSDIEFSAVSKIYWILSREKRCFYSHQVLADLCCCSIRAIRYALSKLKYLGILSWEYRHRHSSAFTLSPKFFSPSLIRTFSGLFPWLKFSTFFLLSSMLPVNICSPLGISVKKDIYKSQSSLRNSIVMSQKRTNMKTVTQGSPEYNQLSSEDVAWLRGEVYQPEPICDKVPSINTVPVVKALETITAHNAQIKENDHSLPFEFSQEHWNQDKKRKQREYPQPTSQEPQSVISKRSIALRQPIDTIGAGAYEHIAVKFFKYEAFLHTPQGKTALSLNIISGNVHQQNFNDYLNESGDSYETAFNIFLKFSTL